MEDQKAENLLNLALSVPEEMRERTEELNVGFNRKERTWEIIVKYHGDLGSALNAKFPDASGTYLFNDFCDPAGPGAGCAGSDRAPRN